MHSDIQTTTFHFLFSWPLPDRRERRGGGGSCVGVYSRSSDGKAIYLHFFVRTPYPLSLIPSSGSIIIIVHKSIRKKIVVSLYESSTKFYCVLFLYLSLQRKLIEKVFTPLTNSCIWHEKREKSAP